MKINIKSDGVGYRRFCRPIPMLADRKTFEEMKKSYSDEAWDFYIECVDKYYWSKRREFLIDSD